MDIGPATAAMYSQVLAKSGTIVWNGPVGVFEMAPFAKGTRAIAEALAQADPAAEAPLVPAATVRVPVPMFEMVTDASPVSPTATDPNASAV